MNGWNDSLFIVAGEVQSEADRLLRMPCEEMFASLATFDRVKERQRIAREPDQPPNADG